MGDGIDLALVDAGSAQLLCVEPGDVSADHFGLMHGWAGPKRVGPAGAGGPVRCTRADNVQDVSRLACTL